MCFLPPLPCLNGDTVQPCVRARVCMCVCECKRVCHFNPLTWTPTKNACPERVLLLMWLLYGCFHIWADSIFYSTVWLCQQLWPHYLPFPVIQECSGPFKPKHSLCLYHQPRETLGLLIHLRIILKQITFNRQGQGTMKICDPCVPHSSLWRHWTLWAGLALGHFMEPILGLDSDQDVIECVGLLNPLTGWQSQRHERGLNTAQK